MAKKEKRSFLRTELTRAALVVGLASGLGFAMNSFSSQPLALFGGKPAVAEAGNIAAPPAKISIQELMTLIHKNESVLIVDVRDEAQYEIGHVPNSLLAPLESVQNGEQRIAAVLEGASKSGALIVTLCDSEQCGKADQAAETLRKRGYKNVRVLHGGWEAYFHSGAKVEEGPRR